MPENYVSNIRASKNWNTLYPNVREMLEQSMQWLGQPYIWNKPSNLYINWQWSKKH